MKDCSKCGVNKSPDQYYIKDSKTGRLHAQCKACYKEHRKTYYKKHYKSYREQYLARAKARRKRVREEFRTNMLTYLSDKKCSMCGEADIRVLEFNHIDPARKSFSISQAVRLGYKWYEVKQEISKCEILCANCHKKVTSEQFGWYKSA